jgi:diacylglycerol kinase family enzyme
MRLAIFNPAAGPWWRSGSTRRALAALARTPGVCVVPTRDGSVTAQVKRLLTRDIECVLACGGDGTVADVAAALEDTGVPLGIVPCGTTNVLAREFGLPLEPRAAVASLERSKRTRPIRLWHAGATRLVLGAGIGWDARLMHRVSSTAKRRFGFGALLPAAGVLAATYDFPSLVVEGVDESGKSVTLHGTSALVANTRYWNGANPALPMADPGDDLLEVVVLDSPSLPQLLAFWIRMTLPGGEPLRGSGVRLVQLRGLTVESAARSGTEIHINGDPFGRTPLAIRAAGLVQVCLPAA